jgi:hypothetical protein
VSGRTLRARVVSGAAILAVAVVSGVISFGHIYDLSVSLHQSVLAARLMPVAIDGLIVVGSVVLLESGSRLGWLGVAPGLALSVFANLESGLRFGWLSAIWAAIPSLSFFLATFIFERWLKAQSRTTAIAARVEAPGTVATVTQGVTVDVPQDVTSKAPVDAPEIVVEAVPASTLSPTRERRARTVAARPAPTRIDTKRSPAPERVFAAELGRGELPSLRSVMQRCHVGAPRARVILAELTELIDAAQAA